MSDPAPTRPPQGSLGSVPGVVLRGEMNPLDLAMVGAGALAFIFSFLKFYTVELKSNANIRSICEATGQGGCASAPNKTISQKALAAQLSGGQTAGSASAWHGFFGWFGVVLLVIAALIVAARLFAPQAVATVPDRTVTLAVGALGLVMVFIALFVIPAGDGSEISDKVSDAIFDLGHGFSYWIVLVLAVVFVTLAAVRFMTEGPGGSKSTAGPQLAAPVGFVPPPAAPGGFQRRQEGPGGP